MTGQHDEYLQHFKTLEAITAELKLVIAGNHVAEPVLLTYGYEICQLLPCEAVQVDTAQVGSIGTY